MTNILQFPNKRAAHKLDRYLDLSERHLGRCIAALTRNELVRSRHHYRLSVVYRRLAENELVRLATR